MVQQEMKTLPIVGARPLLGWRSWNAFALNIDEHVVLRQAAALTKPGPRGQPSLLDLGYSDLGVDDGWQACGLGYGGSWHSASGKPLVNRTRFPSLARLVRKTHALGVKLGWYLNGCWCSSAERSVWRAGTPENDAMLVRSAGFDSVKIDGCGPARDMRTANWTRLFANTSMLVENCANNGKIGGKGWTPAKPHDVRNCEGFHMYRVSRDIAPQFYSTMYNLQQLRPFLSGARPLSRPGCWAYADMLMVGILNRTESRTHFGAWCATSSPLVLSFDLTNATALESVRDVVSNRLALLVQQSWAGSPGELLLQSSSRFETLVWHDVDADGTCLPGRCERYNFSSFQVWRKIMPGGASALLVINIAEQVAPRISVSLERLGLQPPLESIVDIWARRRLQSHGCLEGPCTSLDFDGLAPHDSVFWIVEGAHQAPQNATVRVQHRAAAFRKAVTKALAG